MTKNAINWFEIPVNDLERAVEFYQNMLETTLQRETMDGFEMAIFPADDKAVAGSLIKADFLTAGGSGSLVYLNAEGIMDDAIDRAVAKGSEVLFPKTSIGENGFIAHLNDSEGNRIALHSFSA